MKIQPTVAKRKKDVLRWLFAGCCLLMLVSVTGCRTQRVSVKEDPEQPRYLSAKVLLTIPYKDESLTVNGNMKVLGGERVQFSFLMPFLRSEVARLEFTPDTVLAVDRMGRRYVQASKDELRNLLQGKADYFRLEKLLFKAARSGEKSTLMAKELGLHSLEKGEISLYDFSNQEFRLYPTQIPSRYTKVEWHELLNILTKF